MARQVDPMQADRSSNSAPVPSFTREGNGFLYAFQAMASPCEAPDTPDKVTEGARLRGVVVFRESTGRVPEGAAVRAGPKKARTARRLAGVGALSSK